MYLIRITNEISASSTVHFYVECAVSAAISTFCSLSHCIKSWLNMEKRGGAALMPHAPPILLKELMLRKWVVYMYSGGKFQEGPVPMSTECGYNLLVLALSQGKRLTGSVGTEKQGSELNTQKLCPHWPHTPGERHCSIIFNFFLRGKTLRVNKYVKRGTA